MAGEQWLKSQAACLCQRLPWCPWAQGAIDSSSAPPAPSCCRAGSAPLLSMAAAAYSLPFSREASKCSQLVLQWSRGHCNQRAFRSICNNMETTFLSHWQPTNYQLQHNLREFLSLFPKLIQGLWSDLAVWSLPSRLAEACRKGQAQSAVNSYHQIWATVISHNGSAKSQPKGVWVHKARAWMYSRGNPIDLLETLHHAPVQKQNTGTDR